MVNRAGNYICSRIRFDIIAGGVVNYILLILGMALVTYLPRLVPALFLGRFQFPAWFERWLKSIPYAALGALIFPGVLLVKEDQPLVGLLGGAAACILSLLKLHVTLVMLGSILVVYLLQGLVF
jgi:branched-subunit amino acid transport protein